jgi:hypothetical protein
MAERAKHAFGTLEKIDQALANGTIDSYDILFVKDANGKPYVGWIDKEGQKVICDDSAEFAELEAEIANKVSADEVDAKIATKADVKDVANLEVEIASKANAEEVNAKIATKVDAEKVERSYEKIKYEITDVPVGAIVDYGDKEIRIMCPKDSVFAKQSVGTGGDANCYYMTFRTYVPNDNIVGYKEHLGDKVDPEILTDFKTDTYGRRYQPTWLALAKYDEATKAWTYYGANSTTSKYIGWDYRIDWFDANGKMIASDSVRINLSNENCHSSIKPYYGASEMTEIETKVEEAVEEKVTEKVEEAVNTANAYTDKKIAEIAEAASYEIVEF